MAQRIVIAEVTPTITASSAYSSGNAIGGLLTFTDASLFANSEILSATIVCQDSSLTACDLILFKSSITATADKSAVAISLADAKLAIGMMKFVAGDFSATGSASNVATKGNLFLGALGSVDNNIYGQLIARSTPTFTATTSLMVKLAVRINQGI